MRRNAYAAVATASLFTLAAAQIDPIVIKGSKFFHQNSGEQFYIKGIAYQQGVGTSGSTLAPNAQYQDPLADGKACARDVPLLKELSTNTIRVYAVDPTADHTECMKLLSDAGIYVISDLSQPDESINRAEPTWEDTLFTRYATVIDELQQYDNVIGFFAGNEVSNNVATTDASAFVKAAVRDMKQYIKTKGYREMGVGYATNDDETIRDNLANYFDCGSEEEAIDFWGYNIYEWCGTDSDFVSSGYKDRTEEFKNYNVPVFFAEYGCNDPQPRHFDDTPVLYGPLMNEVWSGGIVYMYFQEDNDFGLVQVTGDDSVSKLPDFTALSSQIQKATATGVNMDDYAPTATAADCPKVGAAWHAQSSPLPPAANPELCACMMQSLSCVVKPSVSEKAYGKAFKVACEDAENCAGIEKDARSGTYGAYGMCNATEQLSFVMDQTVQNGGTCEFGGLATTQKAASVSDECQNLMDEAGTDGTGTVTSAPSGAAATSSGAAGAITIPSVDTGLLSLSVYVLGAMLTGAGMIFL